METWQDNFLDGLLALDQDEAPHGLYGICQANAGDAEWLPDLTKILYPSHGANFLQYIGWKVASSSATPSRRYDAQFWPGGLSFTFETGEGVDLCLLDYAATKVRRFGDTYRIDLHNRKTPPIPEWNLEQRLGGLKSTIDKPRAAQKAVLLVAHVVTSRQLETVVGRTTSDEFLERHSISLCRREWDDRYGRAFLSALYLWSGQAPSARRPALRKGGGTTPVSPEL